MNKSEYHASSFARQGCGLLQRCLFIQHLSLAMYAQWGSHMFDQWSSKMTQSPVFVTILREPKARTLSAYMFHSCGPANASASFIRNHLSVSPKAQACSRVREYENILDRHGLPGYVGLLEARDEFYALLALQFGFTADAFQSSLPLMVKSMTTRRQDAIHELSMSYGFTEWLRKVAARDFFWYEQGVRSWDRWRSRYKPETVGSMSLEIARSQTQFRQQLGLDVHNPITCPLAPATQARLPKLNWRDSGLGNPGTGRGFRYCI